MPLTVSLSGGPAFFLISGLKIQETVPISGQFNNHSPFPLWQRRFQHPKDIMQNKKMQPNLV